MEFIGVANDIVVLITGLVGLAGTAVSAFFAVKAWVKNIKTKNAQEIWGMLMEMADSAMTEAEKTLASGADKKAMAMNTIKASALAAGIDIGAFIDQLDSYIDQTITFVNKMQKK